MPTFHDVHSRTLPPWDPFVPGPTTGMRIPPDRCESPQADLALVEAVRRGDPHARQVFARRMQCIPRILDRKAARTRRLSPEELADLSQETFMLAWERLDRYTASGPLEAWIYRFCCNVLMNARARHARSRVEHDGAELDHEPARAEARSEPALARGDLVEAALARLPEEDAALVEMKVFDGFTFSEIGNRLGMSPNSAKSKFYRRLGELRRWLSKEGSGS